MEQDNRDHFEKIYLEHEKTTLKLEAKRKQLKDREKQLERREYRKENEMRKLHREKKMNERAILEQKRADESMLRLAEEQKTQKEKLRKKILELEKQLDAKQALELEIERLKGALEVMKHMKHEDEEDMDVKKKMETIKQQLEENEGELEALHSLNQALIVKERMNNDELQDARKELMNVSTLKHMVYCCKIFFEINWKGLSEDKRCMICIKKMGELDNEPFLAASKRKFPNEDPQLKAAVLCSLWDGQLRDPEWHPFKVITDEAGNVDDR